MKKKYAKNERRQLILDCVQALTIDGSPTFGREILNFARQFDPTIPENLVYDHIRRMCWSGLLVEVFPKNTESNGPARRYVQLGHGQKRLNKKEKA